MKRQLTTIVLIAAVILGCINLHHQHGKVAYTGTECPHCGSHEVLDLGQTDRGEQHARCSYCSLDYTYDHESAVRR